MTQKRDCIANSQAVSLAILVREVVERSHNVKDEDNYEQKIMDEDSGQRQECFDR